MMKIRIALAAAVLATASSSVPAQDQKPEEEQILTVECKTPRIRGSGGVLKLSGRAELPEFTVLSIAVYRMVDLYAGGKLMKGPGISSSGLSRVERKKFKMSLPVTTSGVFGVDVRILDDLQRPKVLEKIRKTTKRRRWTVQFDAWDDDLVKKFGPSLQRIDNLAAEALSMVEKFEKATATEAGWHSQAKKLERDGNKLMKKLEKDDVKLVMPAAFGQIFSTMRNIVATSRFFAWKEGKFAGGKSYHAKNEKIETHREEPFTYPNLKRYLIEASSVAGREFSLWAVREIKRAGGKRSYHLNDAIKAYKGHPGVAEYSDQLLEAPLDEILVLEKVIRG